MPETNEFVTRQEFNKERGCFDNRLRDAERDITELRALFSNLKGLPDTMAKLDKSLSIMGENLNNLNKQFRGFVEDKERKDEEQNLKISRIDEKSKVDFVEWIKQNWTTVVLSLATLGLVIKDYMK